MTTTAATQSQPSTVRPLAELYALWGKLGDIPVFPESTEDFDVDSTEEPFLHFAIGTPREDIWHWFEAQNPKFIVGEVMEGTRHTD